MKEQKFVQIRFQDDVDINGQVITYQSALYIPFDQYPETKQEDIDKVKSDHVANWKYQIENPPPPIEPTKEQLEAEQLAIDEQVLQLQARKVELADKISAISVDVKPIEDVKPVEEVIEEKP